MSPDNKELGRRVVGSLFVINHKDQEYRRVETSQGKLEKLLSIRLVEIHIHCIIQYHIISKYFPALLQFVLIDKENNSSSGAFLLPGNFQPL